MMPLPLADFNKRPVVFLDSLAAASQLIADLHRAFDALYVLTSNVVAGSSREKIVSQLSQSDLQAVAKNLHHDWATPCDSDSNLAEEIEAWYSTSTDRTPTSYVIITTTHRGIGLQADGLADYAVFFDGPFTQSDYLKACQILHSQLSFQPFNPDWY